MNLESSIGETTPERLPLVWEVGHGEEGGQPARWVAATVPGAVQLDWAAAEGWAPYWQGDNCKAYRWMEDVWWTYRTMITPAMKRPGRRLFFVCGGVDYHYSVHYRGHLLHAHEGMFTPFELDLTDLVETGGWLEIRLRPVPKAPGDKDHREQARLCVKPAVAYGWDWHPRLIPLGIWQETYVECRPEVHWNDLEITYTVDVAEHTAELLSLIHI